MQVGSQLAGGRYILESSLKRTGMAEIWLANQRGGVGFSKQVIIKMIHPDLNEQSEARRRFLDEARLASQIQHPHVVQIHDFGEEDNGLLYLVMEYIQGYDIETILQQAKDENRLIPLPIVCRLMADACQGLGFIHEMRDDYGNPMELVHRDISPQNFVVSSSGGIKIIDFGIVKARTKSSHTRTGVIVGKLQYMSPEQLSSEELDSRSDIYSLGLVLYELLTLKPRFRGNNMLEVFYEALNEPPPVVTDLRPDCPSELVQCVQKALAQKKEHRYNTAYEMQEALDNALMRLGSPTSHRQISQFLENPASFAGVENSYYTPEEQTTRVNAAELLASAPQMTPQQYDNAPSYNSSQQSSNYSVESLLPERSDDSLDHTFSGFANEPISINVNDPVNAHTLGAQVVRSPFVDEPQDFAVQSDFSDSVPIYDNATIPGGVLSPQSIQQQSSFSSVNPNENEEHSETVVFSFDDEHGESSEETVVSSAAENPYRVGAKTVSDELMNSPNISISDDSTMPPRQSPRQSPRSNRRSYSQVPSQIPPQTPPPQTPQTPPSTASRNPLSASSQKPSTPSKKEHLQQQSNAPAKKDFPMLWILLIFLAVAVLGMGVVIVYLIMQ